MSLTKIQPSGLDETKNFSANTFTANTFYANGVITFSDGTTQNTAWSSNLLSGLDLSGTDEWARDNSNAAFTKANTANITYTTSATSPATPKLGDIWFNTNDNLKYEYATDGTTSFWWDTDSIYSGAAYTANTTAPIAPRLGDIWYNTTEDIPYIFSSDGTSTFWWDMQSSSTVTTTYIPITKRDTTTASISISNGYITITNRGGATVNVATY